MNNKRKMKKKKKKENKFAHSKCVYDVFSNAIDNITNFIPPGLACFKLV
jgi:hypothetical protein